MTEDKREQLRELVHAPADLAQEQVQWAERILNTPGIPFGVPCVDEVMNPMHPGDLVVICGRPGHGKTSLMATLARAEARRIVARGTQETEAVFYITWEQVTEEINLLLDANEQFSASDIMRGKVDLETVRAQAVKRVNLPIWVIGDSISRTSVRSLRMFPDIVFEAIQLAVEEHGRKPSLLLFDYIQIIPARDATDKIMQVTLASNMSKELAKRIGCPAVVGVQAGRQVDAKDFKIPVMADAQWSSAIEQDTDKFFGLWRPILTDKEKPPIPIGAKQYPITENLLVVQMSKQRFGPSGFTWGMHFGPAQLKLCELELRVARLNNPEPASLNF